MSSIKGGKFGHLYKDYCGSGKRDWKGEHCYLANQLQRDPPLYLKSLVMGQTLLRCER
jgi:hypothetical protein